MPKKPVEVEHLGITFAQIEFAYMTGVFWLCYACAALVIHNAEFHAQWHKSLEQEEWR